jgi:hypothetical protein
MMRQEKSDQKGSGRGLTPSDPGHDNAADQSLNKVAGYIDWTAILVSPEKSRACPCVI